MPKKTKKKPLVSTSTKKKVERTKRGFAALKSGRAYKGKTK